MVTQTATRFRPTAQGCRFGYPGLTRFVECNRNAVAAVLIRRERDATGLRLLTVFINDPRGNRAATLGCRAEPRCGNAKEAVATRASSP